MPPFVEVNDNDWQTYYVFAFTTTVVTAGLAVLRHFRFRLIMAPHERSPAQPLQFGIRHLLALTLLTAIVAALALHLEIGLSGFGELLLVTLITLPFIAVALVMPWAVLGQTRLPVRGAVLLIVTAVAAASRLPSPFSSLSLGLRQGYMLPSLRDCQIAQHKNLRVGLMCRSYDQGPRRLKRASPRFPRCFP